MSFSIVSRNRNRLRNLCLLAIETPIKTVYLHIAASCDPDAAVQFPNVLPTQVSAVEDQPLLHLAHCVLLGFKLAGQDYKPVQVMALELHGLAQVPIYLCDEVVTVRRDDNPFAV